MRLGAVAYQPEQITLMRSTLDAAVAELPAHCRTSSYKAALAESILVHVAEGEHDPSTLKSMALLEASSHSLAIHDISEVRRLV